MVERKAKQNTNKLSAALPIDDAIINDQILISQPHDDVSLFCSLASFSFRFKPNTPIPLCSPSFPLAIFRPRSCSNVFCSCSPLHRQHAHRIDIALSYLTCDTASTVTLQRLSSVKIGACQPSGVALLRASHLSTPGLPLLLYHQTCNIVSM